MSAMRAPVDRSRPHAVVIGMDCMTGLQSARILRGHGIPVIGIANQIDHPFCRTRACEEILEAGPGEERLIDCLDRLGPRLDRRAVLFPCTDLGVLGISRHRARLGDRFHVVMPSHQLVSTLMDKIGFFRLAEANGFPVPPGAVVHSRVDALSASESLRFPCAIKPAIKTSRWQMQTKVKVFKVHDREELVDAVDRCLAWSTDLLVQEWIPGGDENCHTCNCYLTSEGKAAVSFVTRKVRQWPPQTGIGCLSVESDNEVVRSETIRMFERVGFRGLGYAELKQDERSGKYFVIEPNIARPTGRSAMAEAGGVPLLYTMYADAVGESLPSGAQRAGSSVKWIHLRQDLRAAWSYWRAGELTLRDWKESVRGRKTYAVFSWSDPLPFLGDAWKVARRALRRRRLDRRERWAWTR